MPGVNFHDDFSSSRLLQDLFSPPLNGGLIFHFLPPAGFFSDTIRERARP